MDKTEPRFKYRLHFDYETASEFDLRAGGAWAYSCHPSTRVLCVSWQLVEIATGTVAGADNVLNPQGLWVARLATLRERGDVQFCAWNAAFEYAITKNVFGVDIPFDQWACTMARAAFWGLPMKLDDAGAALGLDTRKDMRGHALMMKLCKPRFKMLTPMQPADWSHHTDESLRELAAYCQQDVSAERAVHAKTPDLPAVEQLTWEIDQEMNARGVAVDLLLVDRMIRIAEDATAKLDARMHALTHGKVPSARNTAKLLKWLASWGAELPNLKRPTVETTLSGAHVLSPHVREALEIRRDAAKASTAKLKTMRLAAVKGRLHGLLQYYGAGRTGRWAGRLVQPQNMPRPSIKNVDDAINAIMYGASAEDLELLFGESALGVVSACLRGCFIASPGHRLLSADESQIEARMVAWLAGQQDILDVFARKEDVYVYTAAKLGSKDRQFGKVLVLACGFGMGANKFRDTAATYRVVLTLEQAEDAVYRWRDANPKIVRFWYDCDAAARAIALGHAKEVRVRSVRFERRGKTMFVWLPSGRPLVYREIGIEADPKTGRDAITYMGVDQKTRKWSKIRTYGGKLVENITQAAARDVIRDALLNLDADMRPVLTVHDELICDPIAAPGDPKEQLKPLLDLMAQPVTWAPGLPVAAEGWAGTRYRK